MNFFVLREPDTGKAASCSRFLPVDGSPTGNASRCQKWGAYLAMLPLLPPVIVELEIWGQEFSDFYWGPANEFLASDRLWQAFEAAKITGLINIGLVLVANLKMHNHWQGEPPVLPCLRVGPSRAVIDDGQAKLARAEPIKCEEGRNGGIIKRLKQVVIQANTWSGEAAFYARGLPGVILVSEGSQKFFGTNLFGGHQLIPAEKFSFNHDR